MKEGDQEEPPIIPPRAALPAGVKNYVTVAGYEALLDEKAMLKKERRKLSEDDERERRRTIALIDGKLRLLNERLSTAVIIRIEDQPHDEVRFGATVVMELNGEKSAFSIVGVDEADIEQLKIPFTAPIVQPILGARVGENRTFTLQGKSMTIKILDINYFIY